MVEEKLPTARELQEAHARQQVQTAVKVQTMAWIVPIATRDTDPPSVSEIMDLTVFLHAFLRGELPTKKPE